MLWGLLAVSIPVIIHLFNFRRFRKVYFTNVRFLEELKQQTHRQSQLRHLLVMILRMLAIASLVIAFSQPYIPVDRAAVKPDAVSYVSIYIDNSFSMEALSTGGPLMDLAKIKAGEIASAYRSTDLFMIVTNDFEGRHQRWVSKEDFNQYLEEIKPSPATRKISEVLLRQQDAFIPATGNYSSKYLISDFQLSISDFDRIKPDSLSPVWMVVLDALRKDNLYIDSCWFASPVHQLHQGVKLVARIVNDSGTDYEKVPLKFSVNDKQKALASFDIPAGSALNVELPFTNHEAGIQFGTLEITDYPVVFDDKLFVVFEVAGAVPVLSINDQQESLYLNSLYGNDSAFRFQNVNYRNIDYSALQQSELIILNGLKSVSSGLAQELSVYLENNGSILVIPSAEMDLPSFQGFLSSVGSNYYTEMVNESSRVSVLDLENPLFADVFEKSGAGRGGTQENTDLPAISSAFSISRLNRTSQIPVMTMLNGKPFLTIESAGKGEIYLLAVPLDEGYSNLPRHAIFVPAFYRIALLSAATAPLFYTIGRDNLIDIPHTQVYGDKVLKMKSLGDDFEFIPAQQNLNKRLNLQLHDQIARAGHYLLSKEEDTLKGFGFNYNRLESAMDYTSAEKIREMIRLYGLDQFRVLDDRGKNLSETIKDMNQGKRLWKLFIIFALAFLALEIILLRFWTIKR